MTEDHDPATRRLNPPDPAMAGTPVPPAAVGQSVPEARQRAATDRQGLTFLGWSMTGIVIFFAVVLVAVVMAIAIFVLHVGQ
jgi:disulfide bond formation protein DsbB